MLKEDQIKQIFNEVVFHTSRSGGKGGQNVNKVETKVDLLFDVRGSSALTDNEKRLIISRYPNLIDGNVRLAGNTYRTQLRNKDDVKKRLIVLLQKLLKVEKKRVKTKPSVSSRIKKAESKKKLSEKKQLRKKIF